MQEVIVYIIIALAAASIVRYVYKQIRNKGGHSHCGGNDCKGCSGCHSCCDKK